MPGMEKTMHEFMAGTLRSGSKRGPVVKNRKQALAIGLKKAGTAKKPSKALSAAEKRVAKFEAEHGDREI